MKTLGYIDQLVKTDRDAWIAEYRAAHDAERALLDVYGETVTGTPADTVRELIARIGYDWTAAILATVVNESAEDGRISKRAIDWAKTVDNAYDDDANRGRLNIYAGNVHRAHLDQIALEFMKWPRPITPEEFAAMIPDPE